MSEESFANTPLDYRDPASDAGSRPPLSGRRILAWSLSLCAVLALLVFLLLPTFGRARETANRVKCASNLKQLGLAALLYSNEHEGRLPPDLVTIYLHGNLPSYAFVCPSHDIAPGDGPTPQAIADAMLSGDHLGYVWVGGGLTNDAPADVVLAFDLEHHVPKDSAPGTGITVLFGDGHAEFVDESTAKAIWAQFIAGVRPVRLPQSAASAPAAQSFAP